MSKSTVFIELFPIRTATLPTLYAYRADETTALSQRAASQLADEHGGGWAQTSDLFVADVPPKKANFAAEAGLTPVKNYTPSPIAQADFLIQALIPKLADVMAQALQLPLQGNFRPLHEPLFKSWAVDGKPALSIGMIRRLVYRQDLAEYAATLPNRKGVVGMTVISRTPYDGRYMSGVVTQLNGTVGEKRGILLRYARTPDAEKRLKRAADDAPVVKVRTFYGEYSLPAHEFLIVLGTRDYARLRVDAEQARQASYQNLKDRAQAVAAAADTLKAMDYIGDSYKSNTTERFWRAADVDFAATVMLGDGDARAYRPRKLWAALKQVGMFSAGEVARPVRIGVINALGEPPPGNFDGQLIEALAALNIPVANVQQTLTSGLTPDEAAAAFGQLDAPDAVIVIIPGKEPTRYSQEDNWAAYVNIKRAVLKAGVPSLCVFERDMRGAASVHEHALAFALAVGYIPYALGAPLPFTDMVVGLTVLRTADPLLMASVYGADGVFIGYTLAAGELSTETATRLLPATFFEGARVVLHTDDGLTDDEAATLRDYAGQHDITLSVTTVGAASNPRLYAFTGRGVAQPPTGTAFRLSERAALLIPALPPHPAMPPNPLHITTDDALPLAAALRAVLAMNVLHPQAKKPRLPVTLHFGERVRRLLAAGVAPLAREGELPWWL